LAVRLHAELCGEGAIMHLVDPFYQDLHFLHPGWYH
jgi:hypothetical protein